MQNALSARAEVTLADAAMADGVSAAVGNMRAAVDDVVNGDEAPAEQAVAHLAGIARAREMLAASVEEAASRV